MKKIVFAVVMITITCFIIFGVYYIMRDDKNNSNNDFNIITNEYESKLSSLKYSKEEISDIIKLFSEEDIKNYLSDKKYDNLLEYKKVSIFNIANIDRYDNYDKLNDYSSDKVVIYVEIGLDKEFYTDINEVNPNIDKLVLVNKYNKLPDNYEASDLITLDSKYSSNGQKVKNEIYINLVNMFNDAKENGLSMKVVSGYRTHKLQNTLFTNSTKRNGLEHALLYSAKPGHSEHQTGYAIDINTVQDSFANTKEYEYLINNSYKYGFIERYPKGKEYITGYGYEPWHYRYVGIEAANIIHEKNITFEEYKVLY